MNHAFRKLALVAALACMHGAGHAFADLGPGSGTVGAGNLRGGEPLPGEPGSFYRDHDFYIRWLDTSTEPSFRFTDLVGDVSSVWRSPSGGPSPYVFTGVELYSLDTHSLIARYSYPEQDQASFTFNTLLEGHYQLRFIGQSVEPPDGFWFVNEWQYSFSAVASPAPEASSLAMSALGLVAVAAWARRRAMAVRTGT